MREKSGFLKGMLIHISHYDPKWCAVKSGEEPFGLDAGRRVVEAMARTGMNLLVVDCADGVEYKSHPELKRDYTVPMEQLAELAGYAHDRGIDVVPKLNFAKSGRNQHDMWMHPHTDQRNWTANMEEYWQVARDLIAELVEVCRPERFFHIGMDEDHYRSLVQYVEAIHLLRDFVAGHNLRTVIWNDSCHDSRISLAQVHAEKSIAAEGLLSRDIVHVLWDYNSANPQAVRRLSEAGFSVWGAPGADETQVGNWREEIVSNGGEGLLLTAWVKCSAKNEAFLVNHIEKLAPFM